LSRPTKERRVEYVPRTTVFKPAGVPANTLESIILTVEELEAIRLKDFEGLEQEACAERMHISRPTFFRILKSAREKVAEALVFGKAIAIKGGVYTLAQRKFRCSVCEAEFALPFGHGKPCLELTCPQCGAVASKLIRLDASGHPCPSRKDHCPFVTE